MKNAMVCLCVVVVFAFCLAKGAWADEVADLEDRIRQLEEENRALKEKIAALESTEGTKELPQQPETAKAGNLDKKGSNGWMTGEYQFDTRGFNTINFTGGANLPRGFTLWGFTDIEAPDVPGKSRYDVENFFIEIDLRRELYKGFGVIAEYNDAQGSNDNLGRFGFNYIARWDWLKDIGLTLYFKAFPIETDGHGSQVSFAWDKRFPGILDGRFSMGGFFDTNFDSGPKDDATNIVSDTQFRFRLIDDLEALVEFRFNEFKGSSSKEQGLGIGLKYKF